MNAWIMRRPFKMPCAGSSCSSRAEAPSLARGFYFMRHGETPLNAAGQYTGQRDVPLSPLGVDQALAARATAGALPLGCVYHSNLQRARHTAELLALPLPHCIHSGLNERHLGHWEGALWGTIEDFAALPPGGGESQAQFQVRVLGAVDEILLQASSHLPLLPLLVAHGGTFYVLVEALLQRSGVVIENCQLVLFEQALDGSWSIQKIEGLEAKR